MTRSLTIGDLQKIVRRVDRNADIDKPKVYVNVVEYDVSMMYPSIVLQWRIDPVHFDYESRQWIKHVRGLDLVKTLSILWGFLEGYEKVKDRRDFVVSFRTQSGSVVRGGPYYVATEILKQFRLKSKELAKKNPQMKPVDNAVKAVLNSVAYGIGSKKDSPMPLGSPYFAYAIFYGTAVAEFLIIAILTAKWKLDNIPCKPVYGDTDSLYVSCERLDEDVLKRVEEDIRRAYAVFGFDVKHEGTFKLMIVYKKKQYVLLSDSGIVVKGGGPKQYDKFFLPAELSLTDLFMQCSEEEVRRLAVDYVRSATLWELGARVSKALYQFICMSEERVKQKTRSELARRLRIVTRWDDVPECYALCLNKTSLKSPVRLPLYQYMLVDEPGGRLTFEDTGGTEIREAYGYMAVGIVAELYQPFRRGLAEGLLIVDDTVYLFRVPTVWYVVRPLYLARKTGLLRYVGSGGGEDGGQSLSGFEPGGLELIEVGGGGESEARSEKLVRIRGDKTTIAGSLIRRALFEYLEYDLRVVEKLGGDRARRELEKLAYDLIVTAWKNLVQPAIRFLEENREKLGITYREIVEGLAEAERG